MLRSRKPAAKSVVQQIENPLSLYATDGSLLHSFDAGLVSRYRKMLTELIYRNALPKRIAMISALRGEGVTFTTLALATTLASDIDRSVCVVELNWWAPGLLAHMSPAQESGTPAKGRRQAKTPAAAPQIAAHFIGRPGLAQVLNGSISIDEALMATAQPNLSMLPAGDLPIERRPVTARSSILRETIDTLAERFDHLIFDIPALLMSSDAIALASLSETCVVVTRHGITPSTAVQQALDDVKHLNVLGVILNQAQLKTPGWLYAMVPQE